MTIEELRTLIAAAQGERKTELERQLATAIAAAEKARAAGGGGGGAAPAAGGAAPAAAPAAAAAAPAAGGAAPAAAVPARDPADPDPANASRATPAGFERVAAITAAETAGDQAAATALRNAPALNGDPAAGGTLQEQERLDRMAAEGLTATAGRYTYPRHYQAEARGKSPLNFVRRYEPGDQALAVTVIGLTAFIANNDRTGARRFLMERGLSEGIGAAGGFLVPDEFAQDVITKEGELTVFATTEFLRVFPMATDVMKVPVLDTRPDVDVIPENASGDTGQDPEIGQVELVARKFGRVLPLSEELVADASIAILDFLRDLYAEILAEKRTQMVTNGNGTSEPEGVRQNANVTTSAFTGNQNNAADVLDWIEAIFWGIKAKYRQGPAIWLATAAMLETLSTVKDGTGRPILSQITDEPFQRLKGKPIFEDSFIPDTLGSGGDESELIFGNFRFYAFGDRQQMTVSTNQGGLYFRDDQIALKVNERYDGKVAQAEAFVRGTGKTVS